MRKTPGRTIHLFPKRVKKHQANNERYQLQSEESFKISLSQGATPVSFEACKTMQTVSYFFHSATVQTYGVQCPTGLLFPFTSLRDTTQDTGTTQGKKQLDKFTYVFS